METEIKHEYYTGHGIVCMVFQVRKWSIGRKYNCHGELLAHETNGLRECPNPRCGSDDLECTNTHTPYYSVECADCGMTGPDGRPHENDAQAVFGTKKECNRVHQASAEMAITLWNGIQR